MAQTQKPEYTGAFEQNATQMNVVAQPYYAHQQQAQAPVGYYPQPATTVVVGPGVAPIYNPLPPKDHLVWSVINLILLCMPLGIPAVIFSVLARNSKEEGRIEDARSHGQVAFGLNVAGTVIGCIAWVIVLPVLIYTLVVLGEVSSALEY